VAEIFYGYGLSKEEAAPVVNALRNNKKQWVDFMMRYELGLEMPDPNRARQSALAIGLSYIAGGLIPLSPYIVLDNLHTSLTYSVAFTGVALIAFGMVKAKFTGISPLKGGLQTVLIGGLAASAAYGLARLFS
jgi:VIT1/CCC1 family predicted Fe2+/Mn2+ transporter